MIVGQEGPAGLELVERVRKHTIAARRTGVVGRAGAAELEGIDLPQAELLIRAFSMYFQLTNLAEEKHRVRVLRRRQRAPGRGFVDESFGAAVASMRKEGMTDADVLKLVNRLQITPVLTAHPTEAGERCSLACAASIGYSTGSTIRA